MKKFAIGIIFLLMLNVVTAQWVMPLDCDKLMDDKEFVSAEEFQEYADVCFYGTGYDEDSVTVSLEGDDTYSKSIQTSNGVISSIANGLQQFIGNVAEGVYRLYVEFSGGKVEYKNDIIVQGSESGDGDGNDNGGGDDVSGDAEVPEFTTIAAGVALLGAGYIINKKRKQVQ